jgi:hypothetical protein
MINKALLIFTTQENNLQITHTQKRKYATSILSKEIKFERNSHDKLHTIWLSKTINMITRSAS